jgi:hypothetical protein
MHCDIEATIDHLKNSHKWKHAAIRFRELRQICWPLGEVVGSLPVAPANCPVTGLTSRKVFIFAQSGPCAQTISTLLIAMHAAIGAAQCIRMRIPPD